MALTAERLRKLLLYHPETGLFTWTQQRGKFSIGTIAGYKTPYGYVTIRFGRRHYMAHRLAWLYTYNNWPIDEIDHIDRNRNNNRILNLRLATHSQNGHNSVRRSNNTSGVKGVKWNRKHRRWYAHISVQGKNIWLGAFTSLDEAAAAYKEAAVRYYGEFAYADRGEPSPRSKIDLKELGLAR